MKFGIALRCILDKVDTDPMTVLENLARIGFKRIEPCLTFSPMPGREHVYWPVEWFEEHFSEIRAMGLEVFSARIVTDHLISSLPRLCHLAESCGIRQFVVKTPGDFSPEALHLASLEYMQAAEVLHEAGAELLLHHDAMEMGTFLHGMTVYEYLLSLCLGKVGAQVNAGCAMCAGQDPESLLRRLGPLVRSIHYDDFRRMGDVFVPAATGTGDLDTTACFQFARAAGIPQIIHPSLFDVTDPMEELARCLSGISSLIQVRDRTVSYLNTLDTETGQVRVLNRFERVIEAPNWLKRQNRILFNSEGHIFLYDPDTGREYPVNTGECDNCNNDHVLSPDERELAVSHGRREEGWASRIYILPLTGGQPRLVTEKSPSYLHGWSPDGRELAYCAFREHGGRTEVDIYTIPAEGGEERRITEGGFNDGPEYSPDGRHIWFNSTRSGRMQIYRMNRDGSEVKQMTDSARQNWFGHISPDGKKVVYLSYREDDLEPQEHLPNMQVELWMMDADGSHSRRLLPFFGGQGSINVNSWAPDSRHIAFVSYELLPGEENRKTYNPGGSLW